MSSSLLSIFNIVISFASMIVFIRFMLQFAGIEPNNPYVTPFYKITQVVDMFGRIFPTVANGRVNLAAVVLLFLLKLIELAGNAALLDQGYSPIQLFFAGSLGLILSFISAAQYLIIGSIIISWIVMLSQKMHPIMGLIMQMAEPILAPFRRIMPNLGMLDLSPMIAILALIISERIIVAIAQSLLPMLG